jgi:hypothetical protein
MQHAHRLPNAFPWRAATLVVGAIAAAELVALIGIGAIHLAPRTHAVKAAAGKPDAAKAKPAAQPPAVRPAPSHPLRPRDGVRVLVLNGNGVQGAASTKASSLQALGYRLGGAENAQRHDYAQSMVMYVPGWVKEARRVARDTGVRLVAPVDGLTPAKLKGSKIVLILGS